MFPTERRQRIVLMARQAGRVDVTDLGQQFKVTTETIRRDLNTLESQGLLHRVHGGAVPVERLHLVPGVAERSAAMLAEKRAIARAAIAEVPVEGAVLIDAGTTTARIADLFPSDRELTVVTNSLPIAESLQNRPLLSVLLLGGLLSATTQATTDTWALHALSEISVDVAFVATTGISVKRGLTTPNPADAAVKRAMVAAAGRTIVVADHSKIDTHHLCIFAPLTAVDRFVTDSGADPAELDELRAAGLDIVVAGPPLD